MDCRLANARVTAVSMAMNIESEIYKLQAENIALQSIVIGLCNGFNSIGHRDIVEQAFTFPEMVTAAGADRFAGVGNAEHLLGAVSVVDQLRASALPNSGQ
jgi:phosphoribosylformylglycinamidine (FGAM) synthase-like amidotransferase family enzyme